MDEIAKIVEEIKKGNTKPIYFLMGEEPYYIDKLSDFIEDNILTEDEKGFNQSILYGRDITIEDIVSAAKRFPLMAEKQVIIVKEAQDLIRTIDNLEPYIANPMPTTILVICYKYKTLDSRKKMVQTIKKKGLLFNSEKIKDYKIPEWISRVLQGRNLKIDPKALAMLAEFLGNNLSKISNELDKLQIILPPGSTITPIDIEKNIGFSKDYNIFELTNAIATKNQLKAYKIVQYFAQNSKEHPLVVTISFVYSWFVKLLKYHGLKDKNPKNVAARAGISPYAIKDYDVAIRTYNMKKVSSIINTLREIDVKSKGVGANNMPDHELLKELLIKIFN